MRGMSRQGQQLFGKDAAESCSNPKCYAQRMAAYIALETSKHPDLVKLTGGYSKAPTTRLRARRTDASTRRRALSFQAMASDTRRRFAEGPSARSIGPRLRQAATISRRRKNSRRARKRD